jgi:alpha-glucoside transport system permease protein
MTTFFNWLGTLNPLLQAVLLVVAFGALVALALYLIDIAVKPGRLYTAVRLAVAVLVPAAILYLFNSYLWAVIVAAVVGGGLFLLDWRSRRGRGYLLQLIGFLLPAALLLIVGLILPSIQTIGASFMNAAGNRFVGLDNFVWIFTQPQGLRTVLNTLLWVLITPIVSTAIGLAYAVFIDKSRGEKFFKVLVFMPMAISFVGASIIWRFVYAYRGAEFEQIGLLNQIVVWFGGEPQQWLINSPWNTFFLIVVLIWVQTGFAMVVLSAAIKGVPTEQLEAAELDGTNAWQRFWNVIVPGIRPTLVVVLTTISIASLKVFDIVRTMTAGEYDTSVVANEMYSQLRFFEAGRSAAFAVVLFLLVLPIVIYNARQLRAQKENS